jgi:CheY-like chemotaxis protein
VKVRVLVVENDEGWLAILRDHFERFDCEVDVASDSDTAMAKLRAGSFDMAVLDMILADDRLVPNVQSGGEPVPLVALSHGWWLLGHIAEHYPDLDVYVISGELHHDPERIFQLRKDFNVRGYLTKRSLAADVQTLKGWVQEVRDRGLGRTQPAGGDGTFPTV